MRGYVVQQWARDSDGREHRVSDDKTVPSLGHAEAIAERCRADAGLMVRIVRESSWEAFVRELGVVLSLFWTRLLYPAISVLLLVFWVMFA